MVMREHEEHKKALHRAVYNDWGLYEFVRMLTYKCVLGFENPRTGRRTRYE
jgi:putative transposase